MCHSLLNAFNFHILRAQSVRRTSLRDKTLTTKKDAVEETRLRLRAQEVSGCHVQQHFVSFIVIYDYSSHSRYRWCCAHQKRISFSHYLFTICVIIYSLHLPLNSIKMQTSVIFKSKRETEANRMSIQIFLCSAIPSFKLRYANVARFYNSIDYLNKKKIFLYIG